MLPIRHRYLRAALLLSVVSVWVELGCASGQQSGPNPVVGVITPEYFRFREVVPDDDRQDQAGGWRAVCIHALLRHGNSEAKTVCKFEVGLPLRTQAHREIPLEEAQLAASSMANRAARDVLSRSSPGEMLAVLCRNFKATYAAMLNAKYAGARVGECRIAGIETVPFGIKLGEEPVP